MVGAVIITHGKLAEGLIDAAEIISGKIEDISTVTVAKDDKSDEIRSRLANAIKDAENGSGVIIFTDMFGGTPTNVALSFLGEGDVEVITGVNLPILIRFLDVRNEGVFSKLVGILKQCGQESMVPAGDMLK